MSRCCPLSVDVLANETAIKKSVRSMRTRKNNLISHDIILLYYDLILCEEQFLRETHVNPNGHITDSHSQRIKQNNPFSITT